EAIGGVAALVWFKVVCVAGIVLLLMSAARSLGSADADEPERLDLLRAAAAAGGLGIWVMAASVRLTVRPELFSFVCLAGLLAMVARAHQLRDGRFLLWALPLLLVWGNVHRGGTLALGVLLAVVAGWALDASLRA